MKWENVSIFISSTFQDMHGERDYLVKEVFPELLSWCENRRLHMYDIDLRWGITREDSASLNTVAACLHNIDKCRPFFICFLGHRRGWVPCEDNVSSGTTEEYPALQDFLGKRSVTEMEIEHALLAPMNRMYEGVLQKQEPCRRALFYFRKGTCLSSVPSSELPVYLDTPENLEKIREFKDVIAKAGYPVTEYDCVFESGPDGNGGLNSFTAPGGAETKEALGQVILRQLKEQIAREFPDHMLSPEAEQTGTHLHTEGTDAGENDPAGIQEEFIWREEQSYFPQKADLDELALYLRSDETKTLCVTGRSGSGKTSLMCAVTREYRGQSRFIPRFCGISPGTSDLYSLLAGILAECGLRAAPMEQELYGNLSRYLQEIAAQRSTVLLLDGLNQCRDGLRLLEILPHRLPDGLKILLSCKEESLNDDLLNKVRTYENVRFWQLKTLCDEQFKRGMIDRFLSQYLKKLDEDSIQLITHAKGSDTPLFISVILSELRVFGRFTEIEEQIRKFNGDTDTAFAEILARLEAETDFAGDMPLSRIVFGLLSSSRIGLDEKELLTAIRLLTGYPEDTVRPALRVLLRQVRPFLARRSLLYDFFHESFRNASYVRYEDDQNQFHTILAQTFLETADPAGDGSFQCSQGRPLTEYPYHLCMSGGSGALKNLLLSSRWIRRKMQICGIQSLLNDYSLARSIRVCELTGGALRLCAPVLMQDPASLAVQLTGRLHLWKKQFPEISNLLNELDEAQDHFWLKPINEAFTPPGEQEVSFRHGKFAITAMCFHMGDLVCSDEMNRIGIYSKTSGERLRLIQAEGGSIRCLASDDRLLYAGCDDGTVSVWQTQSSTCFRVLAVSDCALNDLLVNDDTLHAADENGYYIEYEIQERRLIRKIKTGRYPLLTVDADNGRVCFGGMNQKAVLAEGEKTASWRTGCGYVGGIALSGDSLVYSTFYPRLFFRNLRTGELKTTDYTDGYDFGSPDHTVMKDWRKKGPYIRNLIRFGDDIAIATPFSTAIFPIKGAAQPSAVFPCQDTRTLAYADGVLYAGNGKGQVFSFNLYGSNEQSFELPVYPIISIAREGTHLAVAYETSTELYETESGTEDAVLRHLPNAWTTGIPEFFTDVVPWKDGFVAGSFCEYTSWIGFGEKEWGTLHQSLLLRLGESSSDSPKGTRKMVPLKNHLIFLSRGHGIFVKTWKRALSSAMLEHGNDYKRTQLILEGDDWATSRFWAIAACSDTVFAAATRNPETLRTFSCSGHSISSLDTFPIEDKVVLMENSPDGLLYTLGEDGVIKCWDPRTGKRPVHSGTGEMLQIQLNGEAQEMTVTENRIYVSLAGGYLEVFDRHTGMPVFALRADFDIRSLCAYDDLLYAGTETGKLMVFREENVDRTERCDLPTPETVDNTVRKNLERNRLMDEIAEHLPADIARKMRAGKKQDGACAPRPIIRRPLPDSDTTLINTVRVLCSFFPLIATIAAIVIRQGWPTLLYAFTWGAGNIIMAIFMGFMSLIFLLFQVFTLLIHMTMLDIYYAETRSWWRTYKLPVLDRYILPLLFMFLAVPEILLAAQKETCVLALLLALTIPTMFVLCYTQGVDLFQSQGVTKRLSKDKTFISMEQVFWNLRIAAAALAFILIAACTLAIAMNPQ